MSTLIRTLNIQLQGGKGIRRHHDWSCGELLAWALGVLIGNSWFGRPSIFGTYRLPHFRQSAPLHTKTPLFSALVEVRLFARRTNVFSAQTLPRPRLDFDKPWHAFTFWGWTAELSLRGYPCQWAYVLKEYAELEWTIDIRPSTIVWVVYALVFFFGTISKRQHTAYLCGYWFLRCLQY